MTATAGVLDTICQVLWVAVEVRVPLGVDMDVSSPDEVGIADAPAGSNRMPGDDNSAMPRRDASAAALRQPPAGASPRRR